MPARNLLIGDTEKERAGEKEIGAVAVVVVEVEVVAVVVDVAAVVVIMIQ